MAASSNLRYTLILLLICQASTAPFTSSHPADPLCSSAQLIVPGSGSLSYKYSTEVKLSVANGQYDLKSVITCDVNIKSLGDCNYALQLRNVKVVETQDEEDTPVTTTASAQRELENTIVRFRWVDGFMLSVEADESTKIDNVNFIKGILSALQVYSPVPTDGENLVREEDVLGVCTTRYKYSQKGGATQVNKNKDLSTCSKDKLHLSSSPVLSSLLGPIFEEVFMAKTRYICQTDIRDRKIQSVKCKTVEVETDDTRKSSKKPTQRKNDAEDHTDGDSSEEEYNIEYDDKDDDEISSKLVSIKQELKLQTSGSATVDGSQIRNPVRQTLQFIPTASFDKSTESVAELTSKIQKLLKTEKWDQFAAARFLEITNELRRMDKSNLDSFKSNAELRDLVPTFLNTIYAHDPSASLLNLDPSTLKFANPLSVFYLDKPSKELVEQVLQGARQLTPDKVPEFVGLAATILKNYKNREDNIKDANNKIKEFQQSISKFISGASAGNVTTAVLGAYAQLGLYDDNVRRLVTGPQEPFEVQYNALNAIRHTCADYIPDGQELRIRTTLQTLLLRKLQNKANSNAIRIWSFEALFTPFIYNPEDDDGTLGDAFEKTLADILNEPLNQVNGFIWSALKYVSLDRLNPLRGLAARLRANNPYKKQFSKQQTLSSRQVHLEFPLRKNYEAVLDLCVVFENDRVVPSFVGFKVAFDGIRRETLRLPWVDVALLNQNLDMNFAEYILRLDPLNENKNVDDSDKERRKNNLPPGLRNLQTNHDEKDEDPDPTVHLYLKLFGADIRSSEITDQVVDILRSNLRTFLRSAIMNRLKDLSGKDPIFHIPLEIGAASSAANGLTLYRSAQLALLADLTTDLKNTPDNPGAEYFSLKSRSALSFTLTLQREVAAPFTSIGESNQIGAISNVPFQYSSEVTNEGRIREFNLLNAQSTLIATDFQYAIRTSKGLEVQPNPKGASIDPSCTPSMVYRGLGIRLCLELNPFRSIQLGRRPSYPITIKIHKEEAIKKWRIGWRFNARTEPQYEVAVEKVGTKETYPGLGISATRNGNSFGIKVLTGMKYFNVNGTLSGNRFEGKVYSNENKEVMTASGTLNVDNNGFKLNTKLSDSSTKKEVLTLTTDILPNRGQGLTADVSLTTPNNAKSFQIHFRGDLYKPDSKLLHIGSNFTLGDTTYNGKAHLERSDAHTRIELYRSMKLGRSASVNGYDFVYDRKRTKGQTQNVTHIVSHLSMRTPGRDEATKMVNLKADFSRAHDLSNAKLDSSLDFLILTRNPPVAEKIELDYERSSVRTSNLQRQLISPEAKLKIQVKTKSNVFGFLVDHRHRRSSEPSKKGPATLPPTFDLHNKIHISADTDKLLPDIPRPFAFDVSSDLDYEYLNKLIYKGSYDLRRRQRSASISYNSQVNKVTDGHLYSGTSQVELEWDNKENRATGKEQFTICTNSRSVRGHWDINANLGQDRNDVDLDYYIRFDRQPKPFSPNSLISVYNITLTAPKHDTVQLIDLQGNLTRQEGTLETFNSIAYRSGKTLNEFNVNFVFDRNQTGDGSLQGHLGLALPFKYLPYITHDIIIQRDVPYGRLSHIGSQLIAKPVLAHYGHIDIDRSQIDQPPYVHIDNQIEYLRGNGDILYGLSKIDVNRWSVLYSTGLLQRNTDVLHKHSVGYMFTNKTRKVALSLESPQLSGNPLSIIGELTIDRDNRIGQMKLPQEFGVHVEFGTPLSNVTALQVYYNLPMFNKDDDQTVDATVVFKLASSKIAPITFQFQSEGSLNTTLHITKFLNIGDDIVVNTLVTAQYSPQTTSQIAATTSSKYYNQEFQNSLYALFKNHQVIVRGVLNTTDEEDYKYEMDIGFDNNLLTGHTERTDGKQTTISDINANKCTPTGKTRRCYKGDITIRSGNSGAGRKGTFDVSWGPATAKLGVRVQDQIEINFDHTHTGHLRDDDFTSKTTIDGKLLQGDNRGAFSYSGSVEKEDGKWNTVQLRSSITDRKTGQKALSTDINLNQKITDKRTGEFQRKIQLNLEHKGQQLISWSSDSTSSCPNNPSNVLYGLCQTTKFNIKAGNQFISRLRKRFQIPTNSKSSNPTGTVNYDGTLKVDMKFDPKSGPNKVQLDLNKGNEDAADLDLSFQPRVDNQPMSLTLTANLPEQNPISVKYNENVISSTKFSGTLRYSFNANDASAEKTYQCDVDRVDTNDVSIDCNGERTKLTIDIDRNVGRSKVYVDLNRFQGERIGYEGVRNPQTNELDATLYTFVSSWNIKRQPGRSTTVTVKQNNQEVLRVEGTKQGDQEIQIKISKPNVVLQLSWDNSTVVTLKQTSPQTKNLLSINIDRAKIRPYLPSLRNQDRPSLDIDQPGTARSNKPLVEIAFDSHIFLSLSQALHKFGSHNGRYGSDTIKKVFKVQIGDAPVTVYNVQHWKTHRENVELPESYSVRIVNNANGNQVYLSTYKWNENRLVSEIGHSYDGGKTSTTDLKLDRDYAHEVGSVYFFNSLGYRNIQGVKQLRNQTRYFLRQHLTKDLNKTNLANLIDDLRSTLRSIIEKDYAAVKEIVTSWSKEPEKSFLRRYSTRLGLPEFFDKYPTYAQASKRLFAILNERANERDEFWRDRLQSIMNENRLKDLSQRVQARRAELIKRLSDRAEKLLDRFLPKVDQSNIDKRIADYVGKLLTGFEQASKRNTEQWKAIFKAIDDASKGDDNKWFRTLVADIDSQTFAANADAETAKVIKKLGDSSKLLINNIQQLSRDMTRRQEAIRDRVRNAIRHLPKAYINESNFELLVPLGRQPGSYAGTSELLLGIGSLLRNRDQAFDTIRAILMNRMESGPESFQNYLKALRALAKRIFKRNPSLTPEFTAVIGQSGDAIDLHGNYISINPSCDAVLAHDFADLQFSFQFLNGKVYSMVPTQEEIKPYECSNAGRVRCCSFGNYYTLNVPMYYGGRVDGALGDVRDRSGKGRANRNRWYLRGCQSSTPAVPKGSSTVAECASNDDDEQEFCENFVQNGLRNGLDKQRLIEDALAALKQTN